ncbi:MAG TPA: hypothetical protein PK915_01345 [Bacteroidales bacterium]|nr:hypothetical protein [Bacteroidales bacterium]
MLQLFVISIVLIGLAVAGIAIKMFLIKGGEFKKSCGRVNHSSGKRVACTCGKSETENCSNQHAHHHDEVEFEEITAR